MNPDQVTHILGVQAVQVSVVIAIVGLLSVSLRRRPHLVYALWLAALVKCLVPPVWSSPTGVFSWVAAAAQPPSPARLVSSEAEMAGDVSGIPRSTSTHPSAIQRPAPFIDAVTPSSPAPIPWAKVFTVTWLAGTSGVLSITFLASARLYRRVARSAFPISPELSALIDEIRQDLGLRRRVRVLASDADIGPAVLGSLRPTIVLPRHVVESPPSAMRAVLAHEMAHLRRGDAFVAAAQRLAVALWWFHPLVWWMSSRLNAAREQCCDEETVAGLRLDPAIYAQTLFDVARRRRTTTLTLYPGVHAMQVTRQRIGHLMDQRTRFHLRAPRSAWVILAAAALILLPGAALTRQKTAAAQDPAPATQPALKTGQPLILHGSVADSVTHAPIAGATITVTWQRYTEKPSVAAEEVVLGPPTTLTSNAGGKYDLTIPADWAAKPWMAIGLTVHHPKYGSSVEDFFGLRLLKTGQPDANAESALNRQMPPCEEMTGRILGPDGAPAAGVAVKSASSEPLSGLPTVDEAVTGPQGDFTLHVLKHGPTILLALPEDAGAVQQDVTGRFDAGIIRLTKGAPASGMVTDTAGKPLVGISVVVTSVESQGYYPIRVATTDAKGEYHTAPLATGKYEMRVKAVRGGPLFMPALLTVPAADVAQAPQRIDFKAGQSVHITLHSVDAQGKPTHALQTFLIGRHDGAMFSQSSHLISDDAVELVVPKGVEHAQLGINVMCEIDNKTVARFRRGEGPIVTEDEIQLGTIAGDVNDITVIRYPKAKLTVRIFGPDGKPADELPIYRLRGAYTKDITHQVRGQDSDFPRRSGLYINKPKGSTVWEIDRIIPNEEIKLTAGGAGLPPAEQTVTLKEGEQRSIDIHLVAAPATQPNDRN